MLKLNPDLKKDISLRRMRIKKTDVFTDIYTSIGWKDWKTDNKLSDSVEVSNPGGRLI